MTSYTQGSLGTGGGS